MTPLTELKGFSANGPLVHLLLDPLAASRRIAAAHGELTSLAPSLFERRPPIIHVVGATHAEQVFKNYRLFENGGLIVHGYKGSVHNRLRRGYFSANGGEFDHYIKLFGPLFRKKLVQDAHPIIARVVDEELAKWPADEVSDIVPRINILMKNLASQGLFRDPDIRAGIRAAEMVERHGRLGGASATSVVAAMYGRPGSSRLHRQAQATYDAIIDWGATRKGARPTSDILSAIVNSPDEKGQPASADRIAGYGWTMLGASYDTSTSILSWLMVFLSTHPQAARKLHEELLGSGWRPGADIAALMDLPYLDAVIKEAMRLIPPAPIQRRKAAADTELSGHPVTAGSQILISAWMTNRDPILYHDPERFDPDRWKDIARSPYQWLTFSAGPRRCLGIWFAQAFLKTILAGVIIRWRPRIPDGAHINMKVAVTVRPWPAIPVVLGAPDARFDASRLSGNVHRYLRLNYA
jgi:cytochrome P450